MADLDDVGSEAEHDEGDDLAQAGQGRMEALDLSLVGGTLIAEDDPRHEHGQEARTVGQCRHRKEYERTGQGAQGVEPSLGSGTRRMNKSSARPPTKQGVLGLPSEG